MSKITLEIKELLNEFTRVRGDICDEAQRLYEQGVMVESEEDDIIRYTKQLYSLESQVKKVLEQMLADDFSPTETKKGLEKLDVLRAIDDGSKHGDQLTRFLHTLNSKK